MGSRSSYCCELMMVLAISAIFVPSVLGIEYFVGDEKGWTTNFDYHGWAQAKVFFVGDSLIFNYEPGKHNVIKVNGTGFEKCVPPPDVPPQTSGHDLIQLKTAGRHWYICGVGLHCDAGQKLVITVIDQGAAIPTPSPSPSRLPLPTPSAPLQKNSTNAPPPAPSAATKAAVSTLVMAFTVLAGITIMA